MSGSATVQIFLNSNFYSLFATINVINLGFITGNASQGRNYQILVIPTPDDSNVSGSNIIITQEASTLSVISPISAIVFCTNTLPIVNNNIGTPQLYNNGMLLSNQISSGFQKVLTDFVSDSGLYANTLVYDPSAQFRYISLIGSQPLNSLDLNIYYRTKVGSLIPLLMNSNATCSIKIYFHKIN
jgi:hypothetical protein